MLGRPLRIGPDASAFAQQKGDRLVSQSAAPKAPRSRCARKNGVVSAVILVGPTWTLFLRGGFGGYGASGLGKMAYSPSTSQYTDTHDPEVHDDGTVLVYENGGYSGVLGEEGTPHGYHSRALEYLIDEVTMTATLVWEFPGNFNVDPWYKNEWYIPFWGDADRLANGNVLITAGVRGPNSESRIFEVTKQEGTVVWEFRLPHDFGVYRSERIVPPLVHAIGQ